MRTASKLPALPKGRTVGKKAKILSRAERNSLPGQFALTLSRLMAAKGWDNQTAADKFGVGEPAVRKWLRAECLPDWERMRVIARVLDVADWRTLLPK